MAGKRTRRLVALVTAILVAGCGSSSPSPNPQAATPSGSQAQQATEGTATGSPASESLQPSLGPRTGLEHTVYYLMSDSSGTVPNADTDVTLLFEPNGVAILHAQSSDDQMAHHGSWKYESGTLHLEFGAEDFKPVAIFPLSLDADSVSMPFQVFSTDSGSSSWRRGRLSLISEAYEVFDARGSDQDHLPATPSAAVTEAYDVAVDRAAAGGDLETDFAPTDLTMTMTPAGLIRTRPIGAGRPEQADPDLPEITRVVQIPNGLRVEYKYGPSNDVPLYDWLAPSDTRKLTPGPLAADPRSYLNVQATASAKDDAAYKNALFVIPFANGRFYGTTFAQLTPESWGYDQGQTSPTSSIDLSRDKRTLESHGYEVSELLDQDVTVENLVKSLHGGSGFAPGMVIVHTHGAGDGAMALGVDLGRQGSASVHKNFQQAISDLQEVGLGSLVTYDGGTAEVPKTLRTVTLRRDKSMTIAEGKAGKSKYREIFLAITPSFWAWLTTLGRVSFDRSLFYGASCWSDATPDNREAIGAKAFLGWSESVNLKLMAAVGNYLVDDLVRPSHTAEEAYYNIERVVGTRQTIYAEDVDLKDVIPEQLDKDKYFYEYFDGWAWDGTKPVPFASTGWLDRKMNPGNVWWLLFAGRWDKSAAAGGQKLEDCWKTYWFKGEPGGLKDTFCNAASPGGKVTQDEVAYAIYLLTGTQSLAYSRTVVPRFTLNDASKLP